MYVETTYMIGEYSPYHDNMFFLYIYVNKRGMNPYDKYIRHKLMQGNSDGVTHKMEILMAQNNIDTEYRCRIISIVVSMY